MSSPENTADQLPETMRAWQYNTPVTTLPQSMTLNPKAPLPFPSSSTSPSSSSSSLPPNTILVRVTHMSPNPIDYKLAEHVPRILLQRMLGGSLPASPGKDYAGVIAGIGPVSASACPASSNSKSKSKSNNGDGDGDEPATTDTSTFWRASYKPHDRVFGRFLPRVHGSLGEYVLIRSPDEIAPLPASVSLRDASTVGTAGLTAYQALGHVLSCPAPSSSSSRREVFINGGSGGVGTYAIQMAVAAGYTVTTSCSPRNVALCKSLGATTVIDYTASASAVTSHLRSRGQEVFSLIIDNVGTIAAAATQEDLYAASPEFLIPGAHFVQVGGEISLTGARGLIYRATRSFLPSWPSFLGGGKYKFPPWIFIRPSKEHDTLVAIAELMDEGKIRAIIHAEDDDDDAAGSGNKNGGKGGGVYEFEDAPKAYEKLKKGRTRGNLVVKVAPE
ncbi:NAD(P)-binding protein [Xylariaceae sp. FL0255]|nr:NAD(P)-binding protein [Xylariaceae sp. FL0255]